MSPLGPAQASCSRDCLVFGLNKKLPGLVGPEWLNLGTRPRLLPAPRSYSLLSLGPSHPHAEPCSSLRRREEGASLDLGPTVSFILRGIFFLHHNPHLGEKGGLTSQVFVQRKSDSVVAVTLFLRGFQYPAHGAPIQ